MEEVMGTIDLEVGPYDTPDALRAEIERIKALPPSPEREQSLAVLRDWLKRATGQATGG
jgi:hypothetical protein